MQRNLQPRRYAPRQPLQREEAPGIHFSAMEIASILISMMTMLLAFYMFKISDSGIILGIVIGIIGHEVAHKLVAQSMGFDSRYKLWSIGLVLVIAFAIITRGKFIFAAPGFVVTEGIASIREKGIISLSAPAANIILALLFFGIGGAVGMAAAYINVLLAAFNLLPLGPLDGSKVMEWNPTIWGMSFVFSLFLGILFLL
jgi:Zn-dependent protease